MYSSKSKAHGLFKIDTIGDAYEAAAWLSDLQEEESDVEGQEEEPSQRQRDAEVCACVVNVAWAMIEAVKSYAASRGARIECRIGISSGQVLAGMLGKLQVPASATILERPGTGAVATPVLCCTCMRWSSARQLSPVD